MMTKFAIYPFEIQYVSILRPVQIKQRFTLEKKS